jgi:hypothetical protein
MAKVCGAMRAKLNKLVKIMKKTVLLAALAAASIGSASVNAALPSEQYGQSVTSIFGGGNSDLNYTTVTADDGNLLLALRGKHRVSGATPSVNDVYSFPTGVVAPANNRSYAQMEWEIDVDPLGNSIRTLATSGFTFTLGFDTDPSGASSLIYLDPLTAFGNVGDNSYGDFDTLNGQGVEIGNALGSALFSKVGNSFNLVFFPTSANPFLDGTYTFELNAFDANGLVASASVDIILGDGGAPVPEPSTVIGGLAFAGIAASRLLRRRSGK